MVTAAALAAAAARVLDAIVGGRIDCGKTKASI